ncbi:MAG: response regulator transcription factor [Firmicutes bacterium]|nr:response regulator transcription factor [Bacillota bacterium]
MEEQRYHILLVEDDPKIAGILAAELERYGYAVSQVRDFSRVKEEFLALRPDLVLLDIHLPRFDGYYWCRQIRTVSKVPILFISARDGDLDQIRALEHGGDDYITKPFNLELVVAKVRSALRRAYGEYALARDPEVLRVGDLWLSRATNRVSRGDREVELSPREFRLLWLLAERAGTIVSREELLEALWDDVDFVDDNTLTVNVARVRRRLEELGLPHAIETKRGQGYRLIAVSDSWGPGAPGPAAQPSQEGREP